jgi:hypothetical protein
MGISPVKVPNINTDTVLNRPQNNSNILPNANCYSNTPLNESNKYAHKEPNPSINKNSGNYLRILHQNIRGLHSWMN